MSHSIARSALHPSVSSSNSNVNAASPDSETLVGSVQELAVRTKSGDERAFAELYRRLVPRMRSFLGGRTDLRGADIEEVIQESFLKAWRNIEKFDEAFQFSTWIYTIAIHTAKDFHRKRARSRQLFNKLAEESWDISPDVESCSVEVRESSDNVWSIAREMLTKDQYSAMWLRYSEELSVKEIAKVLKKTSVGVRVSLHRARASLQKAMQEKGLQ